MEQALRTILLDDELPGLHYLKMLCEQLPELEVVQAFDSPERLLAALPRLDVDLCILDIEMPRMTGLELAAHLRDKHLIFTTAYSEYAAEAFDLDAVDYVRKPIQKERLQQAVQKVLLRRAAEPAPTLLPLNTDLGKTFLNPRQLLYFKTSEGDSRDKLALLSDGSRLLLKNISLDALLALLPESAFCRINKKEVLALKAILAYSHDSVTTRLQQDNGKPLVLTLSEVYRSELLSKLHR